MAFPTPRANLANVLNLNMRTAATILVSSLLALAGFARAAQPPTALPPDHAARMTAGLALFEKDVAGLLKQHCVECHSGAKPKGDFDLATRESLLKGGSHGPAVVPFKAAESRLVKAIRHEGELQMPHKKARLPAAVIEQIAKWVDDGAPYDKPLVAGAVAKKDRSIVTEQDRKFRSFQPLPRVVPPTIRNPQSAIRNSIDQFIIAKQQAARVKMNPPADQSVLIRRLYFDLIGLPPTPEEVDAFIADTDPQAYEKLVDRLLANPHHGERWARHWLDLARYGESHGYEQDYDRPFAYHYRDFVIRALNDDLPYDKFVQWQIAGDELAPDNPQAWFATGFLGAGTHATQITANQAEKERYDELDDKVATIGTAMLGLTLGCARCHDHKFDPIPVKDYYALISTFTTTVRSDYDVDMDPARTRAEFAAWERAHQPLVATRDQFEKEKLPARLDAWLKTGAPLPQPMWLALDLEGFKASGGYYGINKIEAKPDGSKLVALTAGSPDTISFKASTVLTNIVALRIEALADRALPNHGPGWSKDGGFNLTELSVTAKPRKGAANPATLKFARRTATTDKQPAKSVLPWSDDKQAGRDHAAVFELEQPSGFAEGTELAFTLKFANDFDRSLLGRVRVSLTTQRSPNLAGEPVLAKDFEQAVRVFAKTSSATTSDYNAPSSGVPVMTATERASVTRIYRTVDDEWRELNAAVLLHAAKEPRPQLVKALVCSEGVPAIRLHTQGPDFYEKTHLLRRGDPNSKQAEAAPSFLEVLMRTPEREKRWQTPPAAGARTTGQRAAFAKWITDVDHGAGALLARVIVNRLWQHHFGRGIVATPSDFGATGAAPTHPELLDWLADELLRNGWQLKPVHRLILNSATYRQGAQTDAARTKADPENRLWWHRAPQRLEAEIVRDNILAVSGRLDRTMFGPGTLDEGMNRRSIYFQIKRSKLIPMMVQFDWPDSLQSMGLRVNTTVAPQALLLMNNPQVRAAARDWAKQLLPAAEKSWADSVTQSYRTALGRAPTKAELANAASFLESQAKSYSSPDARELALTDFCHAVMGLNEFIYVE
jgi:mono/diheme cytochrome c family protein